MIELLGDHALTRLDTLRSFDQRLAEMAAGRSSRVHACVTPP